jgi:hypothetical protein
MTSELKAKSDLVLEQFKLTYLTEVERLLKSGALSDEEKESTAFLECVVALVGETFQPSIRSKARDMHNNLKHF